MFKKNRILVLLVALAVLIGIYFLVDITKSDDRTFRAKVLSFNPELVTHIDITDYTTGENVEIKMENGKWKIYSGGKAYNGGIDALTNALAMLNQLSTESIVATKPDKWEKYKVDDKQAIYVVLSEDGKKVGDIYIGKFDFKQIPSRTPGQQPQTKMTSYVRPGDEDKVYAVNGLLRSNFQGGKSPFRERALVRSTHTDISKYSISGPSGKMVLDLSTPSWNLNGMPVDSTKTDRFLRTLSRLNSTGFIDDVDLSGQTPVYTAVIEGSNFIPVTLSAFPADTTIGFYITSSYNEGSVFDGSKSNLFDKIFAEPDKFLP